MSRVLGLIRSFFPELLALLAMGLLLLLNVGAFEIDPFAELFHVQAARESLITGHFWTPVLSGHDYLIRPPFWTWVVTACFKLGGVSLFVARVPAVLCAMAGLALTYMLALQLTQSRFSALFSALALGSAWGYFHWGSLSTADMPGTDLMLLFFWTFLQWHTLAGKRNVMEIEMKLCSAALGALLGLLCLVKGTGAVLFSGGIAWSYLFLTQSSRLAEKLEWSAFLGPLLAIPLPWLFLASVQTGNPLFMMDYLLAQPAERLLGLGPWAGLKQDWLFYFKQFPLDWMPHLFLLPAAIAETGVWGKKAPTPGKNHSQAWAGWLLLWFGLGFAVSVLSVFKEPSQMLAFYPPLAILVGAYLGQAMENAPHFREGLYTNTLVVYMVLFMLSAVLGAVLLFQVIPADYVLDFWRLPGQAVIATLKLGKHDIPLQEAFPLWKFWLIPGPFILLAGGFALFLLHTEKRLSATPFALLGTSLVFLLFVKLLYLPILHRPVAEALAGQINRRAHARDAVVLYSFKPEVKRVLFYLKPVLLPRTRVVQNADFARKHLPLASGGTLYAIISEKGFFNELTPPAREWLQLTASQWQWDTSRLWELRKFLLIRQPQFERMKAQTLVVQSLPALALKPDPPLLPPEDAETSRSRHRRRR